MMHKVVRQHLQHRVKWPACAWVWGVVASAVLRVEVVAVPLGTHAPLVSFFLYSFTRCSDFTSSAVAFTAGCPDPCMICGAVTLVGTWVGCVVVAATGDANATHAPPRRQSAPAPAACLCETGTLAPARDTRHPHPRPLHPPLHHHHLHRHHHRCLHPPSPLQPSLPPLPPLPYLPLCWYPGQVGREHEFVTGDTAAVGNRPVQRYHQIRGDFL